MTAQQYANNLIAKFCKVVDAYIVGTINKVFVERVDVAIGHSFCKYWLTNSQVDIIEIDFKAESSLAIQKGF